MGYEEKSNNELLQLINNLQIEHEAIKARMLKDYDELIKVEQTFVKVNNILKNRLSGE